MTEERLKSIEEKLNTLHEKIEKLDCFIRNNLAKDCSKMSDHIDFIDQVYETVRTPLHYICSNINYIIGDVESQDTIETFSEI